MCVDGYSLLQTDKNKKDTLNSQTSLSLLSLEKTEVHFSADKL